MDLIRVSRKIREVRLAQKMTVEQLAIKSGFSKGFISRLENFRVNASLNALNKISEALGIELSDIFKEETASPEYLFGNINDGEELIRDNSKEYGLKYFALAYKKIDRVIEPFIIEYRKTEEKRKLLMHESDEFFILLEGKIKFSVITEDNSRVMEKGDTLYLAKNIPHTVRLCENTSYAKALIIYNAL
jgi:transcriptional regulator with XRE-family HTH domain